VVSLIGLFKWSLLYVFFVFKSVPFAGLFGMYIHLFYIALVFRIFVSFVGRVCLWIFSVLGSGSCSPAANSCIHEKIFTNTPTKDTNIQLHIMREHSQTPLQKTQTYTRVLYKERVFLVLYKGEGLSCLFIFGIPHKERVCVPFIYTSCIYKWNTGWRRLVGSPKLQIILHKRATKYRALLRKMTYKDKGYYESSPPCTSLLSYI